MVKTQPGSDLDSWDPGMYGEREGTAGIAGWLDPTGKWAVKHWLTGA
jgi:hypothetical protein